MIKTRKDLKEYLKHDGIHYKSVSSGFLKRINSRRIDTPISDQLYIWKYIYAMRHVEYHINNKSFYNRFMHKIWLHILRRYSYKTGFQISPNTCDKGLHIYHYGYIIINQNARLGKNVTIYPGCIVGQTSSRECPIIGDNVILYSGSKIIGKCRIGDNVIIAPNTVIYKDVPPRIYNNG